MNVSMSIRVRDIEARFVAPFHDVLCVSELAGEHIATSISDLEEFAGVA